MVFNIKDHLNRKYDLTDVKLIAFIDLDGTLTDGTIYMDVLGRPIRGYYSQDSHAMNYARDKKIFPIVVTSSPLSEDIKYRMKWLDLAIFSAYKTKKLLLPEINDLINNFNTAHIGDDLNDAELLCAVDYPFLPANSNPQLDLLLSSEKKDDIIKLSSSGGNGAVRDYLFTLIDILSIQE